MTVLVTGAGVVGRLTADLLAARGDAVVMVDIRPPATPPARGIAFAACDVTDAAALDAVAAAHAVTGIVHTAAMLSTGIRQDPVRGVAVNVLGTMTVLDCARRRGIGRVVCASSTTVGYSGFGGLAPGPVPEDLSLRLITERPASVYAATKIAGEHLALLAHDLDGLDTVVLRYGAVLGGPLDAPTSVPGRLLALLVDGARRGTPVTLDDPFLAWGGREEFVDARDCARANVHALDAAAPRQRVYNVATGETVDLPGFVDAVRRVHPGLAVAALPSPQTGFAGFPHRRPGPSSTEAAARELGFTSRYTLEETIRHWSAPATSPER